MISHHDYFREFAYTVNSTSKDLQKYLGPRTILSRLATATASNGQIMQLPYPFANSTYGQTFFAPLVKCQDANTSIAPSIDAAAATLKDNLDPSIQLISNDYFAFVPVSDSFKSNASAVEIADLDDHSGAVHASNQIWLRISRPSQNDGDGTITQPTSYHYLQCGVHNTSYNVNFTWENGKQAIDILNLDVVNPISHPDNVTFSSRGEVNLAYSAFMWALSAQITGHLSFYQDVSNSSATPSTGDTANRTYSQIATKLEQTILLGSSDLNSYFIKNHALGGTGGGIFSLQRLQDMNIARNRTLDVMIEELSLNITMSLISNSRFVLVSR